MSSDSDSDGSMPGLISNSDSSDESDASSDDEPWPRPDEPAAQPAAAAQPQREEPEPEPEPEPTNPDAPVATVHDIRARPEMNGRRVEAISFDAEKGRYRVREVGDVWRRNGEAAPWGADRIVMVRPDNLGFEGMAAAHAAAMRSAAEAAHRGAAQEAPGSQDAESGSDADQEEEEQAEREAQKKKRARERKKEQQRRARERKRLAAEQAKRMEPIEELTAREKMQKLAELMSGGAVATWSVDDATDWVKYIDLDLGDGPSDALVRVLAAFVEEEIDGEELTSMSRKRLQKMLIRAGVVAEQAEGVAESVLDRRDLAVAVQAAEGEGGAASSAELSALKSALEKAEQGKLKAEEELKEINEDYEEMTDNVSAAAPFASSFEEAQRRGCTVHEDDHAAAGDIRAAERDSCGGAQSSRARLHVPCSPDRRAGLQNARSGAAGLRTGRGGARGVGAAELYQRREVAPGADRHIGPGQADRGDQPGRRAAGPHRAALPQQRRRQLRDRLLAGAAEVQRIRQLHGARPVAHGVRPGADAAGGDRVHDHESEGQEASRRGR